MKNIEMSQVGEKLSKNWEKVLFAVSLVALIVIIALVLSALMRSKAENLAMSTDAPKPRTVLAPQAFAFLNDNPALNKDEKPFNYQRTFAVKQPKKPEPKKPDKPPPPPTPPPVTTPPPATVATPPPARVMKMRYRDFKVIEYKGTTKSASGEMLALISVFDSKTKETQELTVAPGDMIDDLTVGVVTSDMIVITDKKNQEQTITFQSSEKVVQE